MKNFLMKIAYSLKDLNTFINQKYLIKNVYFSKEIEIEMANNYINIYQAKKTMLQ